ncbi:hypothetical protein VTH06DRAFT_8237 [Thermothelomyces fergusii]
MAPTAPRLTARQKARARLADPLLPRKLHRENNVVSDRFIDSKEDKLRIKRSAFLARIAKSSEKSAGTKKKRRRPSKKLVTTLESLGDALDDIQAEMKEKEADGSMMDAEQARQGKVRHKSLKTRPGALKRKEKLLKGEIDRFKKNLAQLANISAAAPATSAPEERMDTEQGKEQGAETTTQATSTPNRWAALRGFISATMEQNPAFLNKT